MKAFMSPVQISGDEGRGRWGDGALAELGRILKTAEPEGPETASFCIERIAARNCAPSVWTDVLAEALAAFVGDEQ